MLPVELVKSKGLALLQLVCCVVGYLIHGSPCSLAIGPEAQWGSLGGHRVRDRVLSQGSIGRTRSLCGSTAPSRSSCGEFWSSAPAPVMQPDSDRCSA